MREVSLPKAWSNSTLAKLVVVMKNGTTAEQVSEVTDFPVTRIETISSGEINLSRVGYLLNREPMFELQNGDILFSHINSLSHIGKTAIFYGDVRLFHGMNLMLLRPNPKLVAADYLALVLKLQSSRAYARREAKSAINQASLARKQIGALPVLLPPLREQCRVVEIFNAIDVKIDKSWKIISKCEVVRSAQFRAAMDPGLHILRSVEASELASIAKSRNHGWRVAPLRSTLVGIDTGNSPDLEDTPAAAGEWGVLKVSAVKRDGFKPLENKIVRNPALFDADLCVRPGDLLITRANTADLVGLTCVVDETPPHLMLCDKTLRLKVNQRLTSVEYIHLVLGLAEVRRQIEIAATGTSASMKNISQESIRRLVIPWGEPAEMSKIVEVDAAFKAEIDALRKEEARLQLLKQGLMNDLLTGRVRVKDIENTL